MRKLTSSSNSTIKYDNEGGGMTLHKTHPSIHKSCVTFKSAKLRDYISHLNIFKILIISFFLCLYAFVPETFAAQNYVFSPKEKIHASISSKHTNSINFEGSPITNVIGEEGKYYIIPDDSNLTLFISPHVSSGESIDLSFTNSAAEVINMVLHVHDVEGQMIFIKNNAQSFRYKKQEEKEIADLLRAMIRDKNNKGKYFVSKTSRKLNLVLSKSSREAAENNSDVYKTSASVKANGQKNYEVIQDRTYSYKNFLGTRIVVTNKDKKLPLELWYADFDALFEQTLSVTIDQNLLPSKYKTYVFIIAKKSEE